MLGIHPLSQFPISASSFSSSIYEEISTNGALLGGVVSDVSVVFAVISSNGLFANGSGITIFNDSEIASGGLFVGGICTIFVNHTIIGTSGVQLSGNATIGVIHYEISKISIFVASRADISEVFSFSMQNGVAGGGVNLVTIEFYNFLRNYIFDYTVGEQVCIRSNLQLTTITGILARGTTVYYETNIGKFVSTDLASIVEYESYKLHLVKNKLQSINNLAVSPEPIGESVFIEQKSKNFIENNKIAQKLNVLRNVVTQPEPIGGYITVEIHNNDDVMQNLENRNKINAKLIKLLAS